jgi:hypothetical protein
MIPCRQVHIEADVLRRVEARLAGMDPYPQADRTGCQAVHRLLDGRNSFPGCGKRIEESIALVVDLVTALAIEGCTNDPAMLRKRFPICLLAQLVQQPRGTLDVREHESDGSGRLLHHSSAELSRPEHGKPSFVTALTDAPLPA